MISVAFKSLKKYNDYYLHMISLSSSVNILILYNFIKDCSWLIN